MQFDNIFSINGMICWEMASRVKKSITEGTRLYMRSAYGMQASTCDQEIIIIKKLMQTLKTHGHEFF